MEKVFASISITTFNRERLSRFCIETIRDTTPRDEYELIVIDNGSEDDTPSVLTEFKDQGVIDKLVLNHPNSLGKAINDAWKMADPSARWFIVFSNDMFCMDGWFENFRTIVDSGLKPDYIFCALRMAGFLKRVPHETKNGGSFVTRKGKWPKGYPFGGGLAIKRSLIRKKDISFAEDRRTWLKGSIYTLVCARLASKGLKCVELGKPCILFQDCEFSNPEYEEYYYRRFALGKRGTSPSYDHLARRFDRLRKNSYTSNPEAYYKGSGYKISNFYSERRSDEQIKEDHAR